MPRIDVPVTQITRSGVAPAGEIDGDPVNGHSVSNTGGMWIEARNASTTAAHTLSAHFASTVDGVTVDAKTWSIPAEQSRRIGPFPTRLYGTTLNVDVGSAELKLAAYTVASQT
ncbi:hypothetical protein ACH49_24285 [Streptomyces leeuwenhoekii]|uniref:Secreted Protein n=1 Tax=Streptomyces leeuwenhoekii TaxID=1437453 RepID=A0ABR5HT75_STRLW|nr:hypothetical protein [Streptomyces leeuwenhoekii]KMS71752.1 hypothetical protein ACH49_24285 [Streptomyces leeuwenhoekii]